jgi:hypothetical protein
MKYLLPSIFLFLCLSLTTNTVAQEKKLSKEEKEAIKAKKEANLQEAFNKAGLTVGEQEMVRTSYANRSSYKKLLKIDTSLSEDKMATEYKAYSKSEEDKLKDAFGKDKYKIFRETQNEQKELAILEELKKTGINPADITKKSLADREAYKNSLTKDGLSASKIRSEYRTFCRNEDSKLKKLIGKKNFYAFRDEQKNLENSKKEDNLKQAIEKASLTAEEQQKVRISFSDRSAYRKLLKMDTTLSEADLDSKYKEYSKAQDEKLRNELGRDRYRAFKNIQKAQKLASK